MEALSSEILSDSTQSLHRIHANQRQIESLTTQLHTTTSQYTKNIQRWHTLYGNLHTSLKQFGDLNNWSTSIEEDMSSIAVALSTIIAIKQHEKAEREKQQKMAAAAAATPGCG